MFRLVVVSCLLALSLGANIPKSRHALRNLRNIFPSGRIVGGQETDIKDVPWQVAVEWDGFQFCGGSIISEDTILCAGHCVEDFTANEVSVRTGSSKHESGGTLIDAAKLIQHPQYSYSTLDYDVSVIKLAKPIELGESSQPVAVSNKEPQGGESVLISGWGTLTEGGETPNTLYSVVVPVVDRKECESDYEDVNDISSRMLCAGEAGKDSCQGDSGGPVVWKDADGNVVQVGIVSWGLGCAEDGYPGVYTNCADPEIRQWIKDNGGV